MSITRYFTNMRIKTLKVLGSGVCLAMLLASSSYAQAPTEPSIEGTWIVTVDRINEGVKFAALQSFTAGGVALATGAIDRTPPPAISPIYGSWKLSAGNKIDTTIFFFVFDTDGHALFLLKNNETFRLTDANKLEGHGVAFMCDLQAENCVSVGSPIEIKGRRIVAEGVPDDSRTGR